MKDFPTPHQQLVNYIIKNLNKGYTADTLKYSLLSQGYGRTSVQKAIDDAHKQLAKNAPVMKEKPQITYEVIDSKPSKTKTQKPLNFFQKLFKRR